MTMSWPCTSFTVSLEILNEKTIVLLFPVRVIPFLFKDLYKRFNDIFLLPVSTQTEEEYKEWSKSRSEDAKCQIFLYSEQILRLSNRFLLLFATFYTDKNILDICDILQL